MVASFYFTMNKELTRILNNQLAFHDYPVIDCWVKPWKDRHNLSTGYVSLRSP
jgi:hypothetical protein